MKTGAKRAWNATLSYKGADPKDKGSFGIYTAYRHIGLFGTISPGYDTMMESMKGWEFGADYVFTKNIVGGVKYFTGRSLGAFEGNDDDRASTVYADLHFYF